ncbi:RAP protein, putative [Plasmodium berghei]|uniref:Heptatricopeptide repeat and RAP domain-containing protein, putative n=2 Tax=Plasmodium berghei TaxID=5821 RepID=A0A509AZW6_PLABA|nr:heptatricopeptide repeat and RAP domain-containing protein, putative [Plasmodium berghei ANKA]CXJ16730.1 RAP protein, putative [Plasmodium berghei]SCM26332.1 RAP protein, putative [Plasmodium berghei]SCN28399.1 RAP protein, putative [Plasmodium berghei]SCO62593.1 RAP protein, putative [Plasmodium berghei]SCO64151.1 RAP protein, putative [Plasmodium berghei]|eukprot:XP_034424047.1 heptatricopeptide repeat and RAP domain-containing protein, putative [Plasmodium berghei ANKA]
MCICISNCAINITKITKAFLNINEKKYIRTGKFNDLVCKKKILNESIENKLNEVSKQDINQVNILKLFSIDEIKSGIPRRYNKRKTGSIHESKKNNENREKYENETLSNINKPADNCNSIRKVCANQNKIILKKNDNTQNSIKNYVETEFFYEKHPNFIEDKNSHIVNNRYNIMASKKKSNKKNYNQYVILNKLFRKKYICIENNIKLVDSYINKKYHIEVKKRNNNQNGQANSDTNDNNVFNYSEERSIQLLDEINEKDKFQNKKQDIDNKKNNNNELQISSVDYENKNRIIKKIYKASINHVRDENLWKKYVQNVFTISAYLDASEIVILFWCFSKIGYRDNRLINLLSSIILKKINELSCCALSLLLNSFKKLEIKKYDTIELLTNQFCFHVSNWKFQDIALVANSLAFFYIYHKNFWKKCILKLQQNYNFSHPLHLCLVISSFARLDIREGNILLCLFRSSKKLASYFSPNNLALVIHSFAKLKFNHPRFFNYLYQFVHKYLDKQLLGKQKKGDEKNDEENFEKNNEATNDNYKYEYPKLNEQNKLFDLQSLVLLLFSCTCLISCTEQMILKLTYLIIPNQNFLGNHKIDKLKYVSDYLQYFFPLTFEKFPEEIKKFYYYIDRYEIKNKKKLKYNARWITEVSRILTKINVNHLRNVYINNICADIMLPDSNIIIMCLGPYSYYVNSLLTTSISDLKKNILEKKKYNVITLNYHDWNKLNDYEDKINFLYSFGRNAANYFFFNTTKDIENNINPNMSLKNVENSESWENDQSIKKYSYELCQEQESENNFSDEDNEIIDFIKKGICVNDQKENIDSYDVNDIKFFLNNTPNHEK